MAHSFGTLQAALDSATPPFTPGPCGAFGWYIWWERKDAPLNADGVYILQHVVVKWNIVDCDDKDVTLDQLEKQKTPKGNRDGGKTWEIWEAWQIPQAATVTEYKLGLRLDNNRRARYDDVYGSAPFEICTKGKIEIRGTYGEVRGKIPNPPLVPQNRKLPTSLHATGTNPNLKTSFTRKHDLVVEWDCCPEMES